MTINKFLPFVLATDTTKDSELYNQKISGGLPSSHLRLQSVEINLPKQAEPHLTYTDICRTEHLNLTTHSK